jgi:hypothetical protein
MDRGLFPSHATLHRHKGWTGHFAWPKWGAMERTPGSQCPVVGTALCFSGQKSTGAVLYPPLPQSNS